MTDSTINSLIASWIEEKRSVYLYQIIAKYEKNAVYQTLFKELANAAGQQAIIWQKQIEAQGGLIPVYKPDRRTRFVGKLIAILGARRLQTVLAALKVRGMSVYSTEEPGHPMPKTVEDIGRKHKGVTTGGNLRAAVFGVNDGLVSNASIILGMAGANANHQTLIMTGIAGLLAGAFSMGAGEYISVKSQREMFEHQIGLEKKELELYPEEEAEELSLIYQARGLPKAEASRVASAIIKDPVKALDVLAKEELGLNPKDLGSAWGAAIFSFCAFTAGAFIPLFPFLFGNHAPYNLFFSMLLTVLALFTIGGTLSLFTGRNAFLGGLRMLAIGAAAGCITYLIGHTIDHFLR